MHNNNLGKKERKEIRKKRREKEEFVTCKRGLY